MRKRDGRLAQKTQRNPAGGKMLLGAVIFVLRRRRAVGDLIGQSGVAEIEQFSRHQPPFHPPLVDVDQFGRIARRGVEPLRGLGNLVVAPQPLNAAEHVAGVAARRLRHRVEQRLGVAGLIDDRGAGFGDGERGGIEMMRRAQSGVVVLGIEPRLHAHFVVGRRDQPGEGLTRLVFEIGGKAVIAPGLAHRRRSAGNVAAREQRARQREAAFGGVRLFGAEKIR